MAEEAVARTHVRRPSVPGKPTRLAECPLATAAWSIPQGATKCEFVPTSTHIHNNQACY